jgi:hypothetical protein
LYRTFKYFLTQRNWDNPTPSEKQELWIATMATINMPSRSQAIFLERDLFLSRFEHVMRVAHVFRQIHRKEGATGRKQRTVRDAEQVNGHDWKHPRYHDALVPYQEWLENADAKFADLAEKWDVMVRDHFLGFTMAVQAPAVREATKHK